MIEQAKGAVARTLDVDVDEAFNILRRYARQHRVKLTDLARDVLDDKQAMSALTADADSAADRPVTPVRWPVGPSARVAS